MTPDVTPPDARLERAIAVLRDAIPSGHHDRCVSGQDDEQCDCYARFGAPYRQALDDLSSYARRTTGALRDIVDLEDKTYWDDPSAGFAAIARAALDWNAR